MKWNESIPLYRDGRHYDALNSFLVADIPFYEEEARKAGGLVLELACGTGRLTIPIARSGVEIVGLDLSASMLAHARTKAKALGVDIEFVEGDCRSFDLGRKFALIFMAFNSMQHLHDYCRWRRCSRTFASIWRMGDGLCSTCSIRKSRFWPVSRGPAAGTRVSGSGWRGHDGVRAQRHLR